MKDRNSDLSFQLKADPNQAMKQAFVVKQLWKTFI